MPISKEKAMYFWHRHLEGADPEKRTLKKWNSAFPQNLTSLQEITEFITSMEDLKTRKNVSDNTAMQVLCGETKESDLVPTKKELKVYRRTKKEE